MIDFSNLSQRDTGDRNTERKPITVNVSSQTELIKALHRNLEERNGFTVATLNLDHLVKIRSNSAFERAYSEHTYVTADGNPIVWLHALARSKVGLVPGSSLIEPLVRDAAQLSVPIALLGSTEDSLSAAADYLKQKIPHVSVVAKIAPPMGFDPTGQDATECIKVLVASGAQLCFIALGAPKQEIFAHYASSKLPNMGFVSIGAGLDFLSGKQKRAPYLFRRLALEWLWRLCLDPKKLANRYLACFSILPAGVRIALHSRRKKQR